MIRTACLAAATALAATAAAYAHHGWSWAEDQLSRLTGVITEITIAPPHPTLLVRDAGGTVWTVELGNPGRTRDAGFVEGTAAPGDEVVVLGNRDQNASEAVIKAVRITIEGRNFDFYPERIPPGV